MGDLRAATCARPRCTALTCWPAPCPLRPAVLRMNALQAVRGNVGEVMTEKDQRGQKEQLLKDLDLEQV